VRSIPGQPAATRLLEAAVAEPRHAYLLWGPRGVAIDEAVDAFCAELLDCDERRVTNESHPDLFVVEPEGEAILIDQIRTLREDLYLRPFESSRRVYVLREVETLRAEAANALLKSLEEPPAYAVFVLVTHDRARLLSTITSRCQPIVFHTPPPAAISDALGGGDDARTAARLSRGNLTLARRLYTDPAVRERLEQTLDVARDAAAADTFDASTAATSLLEAATQAGNDAEALVTADRDAALTRIGSSPQTRREAERVRRGYETLAKRRRRRAETDELRAAADAITGYWRDVLCVTAGAHDAVISTNRSDELGSVAGLVGVSGAVRIVTDLRDARASLDLPVVASLALERLLLTIRLVARAS
jgi:DNA polymerase III subunit delta'